MPSFLRSLLKGGTVGRALLGAIGGTVTAMLSSATGTTLGSNQDVLLTDPFWNSWLVWVLVGATCGLIVGAVVSFVRSTTPALLLFGVFVGAAGMAVAGPTTGAVGMVAIWRWSAVGAAAGLVAGALQSLPRRRARMYPDPAPLQSAASFAGSQEP
jgi:hypothetical protein